MSISPATTTSTELDAADPLAGYRERFLVPAADPSQPLTVYLDGNSLGRPLAATAERLATFVRTEWGAGLIRSWDAKWMDEPTVLGDRLGEVVLGAAPGQTLVGDSTSVLLYKALRAALDHQQAADPQRCEIVIDAGNFPTDRFIVEGIAAERGATLRWVTPNPATGVTAADLEQVLSQRTAVVLLSHVAYRSGYLADAEAITAQVKATGALMVWDLCHSAGAVPLHLDDWGVDLAVGCTYKYLNGGPGSPALIYVASGLQSTLRQPIWGWMGAADPFGMTETYEPSGSIRRFITGTPPILAMQPLKDMVELIAEVGIEAIRVKSVQLTEHAVHLCEKHLLPLGAQLASPRDTRWRGSHVTVDHPDFAGILNRLWDQGVIPDFRPPNGLRIGLSPLSTSFAELEEGIEAIAAALADMK